MTDERTVFIDAAALWARQAPGWDAWCAAVRGGECTPAVKPSPSLLSANERRRASDSVLLAVEVAEQAVRASGRDASQLASVFTSAHGDLPITDALCTQLAQAPLQLSPTRFHHSVHNAASGYWAIASGCRAPSSAVSAHQHSFAAGLLEALVHCACEQEPVLLVGYDTEALGLLADVNGSRGLLGVALVLSPERGASSIGTLHWRLEGGDSTAPALRSAAAQALGSNAMSDALPLFESLAVDDQQTMALPLPGARHLALRHHRLQPIQSSTHEPHAAPNP
jgi:Beta-ketoacyl synthase, N-terminal domain